MVLYPHFLTIISLYGITPLWSEYRFGLFAQYFEQENLSILPSSFDTLPSTPTKKALGMYMIFIWDILHGHINAQFCLHIKKIQINTGTICG